jgi:hypothetical protein
LNYPCVVLLIGINVTSAMGLSVIVFTCADTKGWPIVPRDAKSILVQPFEGEKGGLILLSYQPRSYSSKDRTWVAMMAEKFSQALKT